MFRFSTLIAIIFFIAMPNAQAGFEFLGPKGGMAPQADKAQVSKSPAAPQPIAPQQQYMQPVPAPVMAPNAYPAAPVMGAPIAPPAPNYQAAPQQQLRPVMQPKTTGLYIDPFPLRTQNNVAMQPSGNFVAQAMAENGGGLTPVQLGAGMTSGAKAQNAQRQAATIPRPPMRPNMIQKGLTPIPGGEPAPLPNVAGIEDAYRNAALNIEQIPVDYANAVGFGKDLPLELALSQIVPAGFTYDIKGNAGQNMMVSWEGGQPWNIVLNDMLRSIGMTAVVNNDRVVIQPIARG